MTDVSHIWWPELTAFICDELATWYDPIHFKWEFKFACKLTEKYRGLNIENWRSVPCQTEELNKNKKSTSSMDWSDNIFIGFSWMWRLLEIALVPLFSRLISIRPIRSPRPVHSCKRYWKCEASLKINYSHLTKGGQLKGWSEIYI